MSTAQPEKPPEAPPNAIERFIQRYKGTLAFILALIIAIFSLLGIQPAEIKVEVKDTKAESKTFQLAWPKDPLRVISGEEDKPDPKPDPDKPEPKPDTLAAIGRIQFGTAGCTATIIGPQRPDGKWWVLTAAHCIKQVGQPGKMLLRDGRTLELQVVAFDKESDGCWCETVHVREGLPFAMLATKNPTAGQKVWHAGYGFDRPGNREDGYVEHPEDSKGQTRYHLNVSSGDSGGGIAINANGEILSPVCCTTRIAAPAHVWGASPESLAELRPRMFQLDDWTPIDMPQRPAEMFLETPEPEVAK